MQVAVTLKNTGSIAADEVVQLYLSALESRLAAPVNQLIAFQRVCLKPEQVKNISFNLQPETLMLVDEDGQLKLEPGKYRLTAGGCSPGLRGAALGAPQSVSVELTI